MGVDTGGRPDEGLGSKFALGEAADEVEGEAEHSDVLWIKNKYIR